MSASYREPERFELEKLNDQAEYLPPQKKENFISRHVGEERINIFKKVWLTISSILILIDQGFDVLIIVSLYRSNHPWYGTLFLLVDLIPGLSMVLEMLFQNKRKESFFFVLHPWNLLHWTIKSIKSLKHEETLRDVKATHTAIESSWQILLRLYLISKALFPLPGPDDNLRFKNPKNAEINLRWLPVVAILFSLVSILLDGFYLFQPVEVKTNGLVGKLAFIPMFAFRLTVWILLMTTMDGFAGIVVLVLAVLNPLLLLFNKNGLKINLKTSWLVALVLPVNKIPSLELNDVSLNLRSLFTLSILGNFVLFVSYLVVYVRYVTENHNPWCLEDLNTFLLPEEWFRYSLWGVVCLFVAASLPVLIAFFCRKSKWWTIIISIVTLAFTTASVCLFAFQVFRREIISQNGLTSIKTQMKIPSGYFHSDEGWGPWVPSYQGNQRFRRCPNGETLMQVKGFSKVLVGLGFGHDNFEVIDLESPNNICKDFPRFPYGNELAIGGLGFQNEPIICGGKNHSRTCLGFEKGKWKAKYLLNDGRRAFAMTMSPFHKNISRLIVSGGLQFRDEVLDSVEVLTPRGWKLMSFPMPDAGYGHCMVAVNSSTVAVIGGPSRMFWFNADKNYWIEGPELNHMRYYHSCSLIRKDFNSNSNSIIVVGGWGGDHYVTMVEVLHINESKDWQIGPKLYLPISEAPIVQDPAGGVVLMGGFLSERYRNKLYRLPHAGPNATWEEMPQKLKYARISHTAFLIPDQLTNCTQVND